MSTIDWSKVPEGFDVHIQWSGRCGEFYKEKEFKFVRDGGKYAFKHDVAEMGAVVSRRPWNGEGLPPVGAVCEWNHNLHGWVEVKILGHDGDDIWYRVSGEVHTQTCRNTAFFRPIRTPEQIAAEERAAGLNEMIQHIKDHPLGTHGVSHLQELMIHEDVARDLWEAGYRKQEDK